MTPGQDVVCQHLPASAGNIYTQWTCPVNYLNSHMHVSYHRGKFDYKHTMWVTTTRTTNTLVSVTSTRTMNTLVSVTSTRTTSTLYELPQVWLHAHYVSSWTANTPMWVTTTLTTRHIHVIWVATGTTLTTNTPMMTPWPSKGGCRMHGWTNEWKKKSTSTFNSSVCSHHVSCKYLFVVGSLSCVSILQCCTNSVAPARAPLFACLGWILIIEGNIPNAKEEHEAGLQSWTWLGKIWM